jgi:hypothetical protein
LKEDFTMKTYSTVSIATILGAALLVTASHAFARERGRGGEGAPVIFVTSQGLYYDSIALGDLPLRGEFQELSMGVHGLETEFGPGEPGHLGGRWWIDLTGDGVMNEGDRFFLCPLLGPGRAEI